MDNKKIWLCWVSKMVIPVYGVSEGEALSDWIYKSHIEPRSLGAKSKIQSDRFDQTFYEARMLKALIKTTLRYQISSSAHW